MLTRWAIALQSFDFTVEHKPGRLNVIPDALSRLFEFEKKEENVAPLLAPICRNVPENPALHGESVHRLYQVSAENLDEIAPVSSDRELFTTSTTVSTSATNVFMSIDQVKLRQNQKIEFGPYLRYVTDPYAPLPGK